MKKIYILAAAALFSSVGFAQSNVATTVEMPTQGISPIKTFTTNDYSKTYQNKSANKAMGSFWVDYSTHYQSYYSSTPYGLIGNNLFPDSTILANYGSSGYASTWVHAAGQVFDLNAPAVIFDGVTIDGSQTITIDSIQVLGVYSRVDPTSTDTLRIQVVAPSTVQMSGTSYFSAGGSISNNIGGGDTVFIMPMDWAFTNATVGGTTPGVLATYKIPLDANFFADSTVNGLHIALAATNVSIPAPANAAFQNKFGIITDFIPGYSWVANQDTINENKNGWWFGSLELNGQNQYPSYDKTDFNAASILPQDVRYNTAGGWNNSYIPSFAYMGTAATYAYEAMAISAYVTGTTTGVDELTNDVNFSVYPNPSNGVFTVNLNANDSKSVNLTVRNLVGQTIINKTLAVSGKTVETISLSNYSKGVYFLTIDNNTTKLIVE
jgi:hypothetical protein